MPSGLQPMALLLGTKKKSHGKHASKHAQGLQSKYKKALKCLNTSTVGAKRRSGVPMHFNLEINKFKNKIK